MPLGIQACNFALHAKMVGTVRMVENLARLGLKEDVIVKVHLLCLVAMTMAILLSEVGEIMNLGNVKKHGLIRMVFSMEAPNSID